MLQNRLEQMRWTFLTIMNLQLMSELTLGSNDLLPVQSNFVQDQFWQSPKVLSGLPKII